MKVLFLAVKIVLLFTTLLLVSVPLYALPAALSLESGIRPDLEPLTLAQAEAELRSSGLSGWALVEAARSLVGKRMAYCRRNSFDLYPRAFERGYGYCQQMAFALKELLVRMGYEADVYSALRNRFEDGSVGGHAWVRVVVEGQARQIDPLFWDEESQSPTFEPLSRAGPMSDTMRLLGGWGATGVNAHRFYRTGTDRDF